MRISLTLNNKQSIQKVSEQTQEEVLERKQEEVSEQTQEGVLERKQEEVSEQTEYMVQNNSIILSNDILYLPENKNYGEYIIGDIIEIEDNKNEIIKIETNNSNYVKINNTIRKTLLKKYKKYRIYLSQPGCCNLKIHYKNKSIRIFGIFIRGDNNDIKLGTIYDNPYIDYWKDDNFVKNKRIDTMYINITNIDLRINEKDIINHMNNCKQLGTECKIVYRILHSTKGVDYNNYLQTRIKYTDKEYMKVYINNFIYILNIIKNNNIQSLNTSIIYEPYFLTNLYSYEEGNDPKNIYINYSCDNSPLINLVDFINYISHLCESSFINLINVFNIETIKNEIQDIVKVSNINNYMNILDSKINHIVEFYNNFENKRYLAFDKYHIDGGYDENWLWCNDEWLSFLYIIKNILEKTKLKGLLYEIPVGHMNGVIENSIYTNKKFEEHSNNPGDLEDSSTVFLFGGCFKPRHSKFYNNIWKDPLLRTDHYMVCFNSHISLCKNYNIDYILFGPGSDISTTNIPLKYSGDKCSDHNYTITKLYDFYNKKK